MPLRVGRSVVGWNPPSRTFYVVPLAEEGDPYELERGGPDTTEIAAIKSKWDAEFGDENPDDLVKKVGLRVYEKMQTHPTVKGGSRLISLGVVGPGYEIVPAASGERLAEAMAENVDWIFTQLAGPFKNVELGILSGRTYGFSNSVLDWGVVDEGEWRGKWALRAVKTKPPFSYGYNRDEFGNLLAITHKDWSGHVEDFTNLKKWVMYAHDVGEVFGNPYGRSQLRPAYDYWKAERLVFRMRGVFVERTASGIPLIRYKRGLRRPEIRRYEKMVRMIQTAAGMAIPDDVIVEWAEKKGESHEEFERFSVFCERKMLQSMLVPSQMGIGAETQVGSMAKARVHQEIFEWVMDDMDTDLTAVVNEQLVQRICDNNFPNAAQVGYPIWRHKERSSSDAIKLVAAYVKAAEGEGFGPITLEDVNTARRRLGHAELSKTEWDEMKAAGEDQPKELKPEIPEGGGEDDKVKEAGSTKTTVSVPAGTPGEKEKIAELAAPDLIMFARQQPFVRETLYRATVAGQHDNPRLYRELTRPEKAQGLQPKKYSRNLDQIQAAGSDEVMAAFTLVREKLVPQLERRGLLDGTGTMADLWGYGGINGTAKKRLTNAMHHTLLTGYIFGAVNGKDELERGTGKKFEFEIFDRIPVREFAELRPEFLIEPNEAREYWSNLISLPADVAQAYKAESIWVTGLYLDDHGEMLRQVKEVIRQGFKSGNWAAVEARVNALFDEWVGTGRVTQTGQLFQPWHTHTIVRNAVMRSYNAGRAETFRQGRDWIERYQWASIIDERTSDFCDGMDGVVFMPGQVEFPPAHHQCRSIIIAVLKGMGYTLAEAPELNRLAGLRDTAFSSGIMGII